MPGGLCRLLSCRRLIALTKNLPQRAEWGTLIATGDHCRNFPTLIIALFCFYLSKYIDLKIWLQIGGRGVRRDNKKKSHYSTRKRGELSGGKLP